LFIGLSISKDKNVLWLLIVGRLKNAGKVETLYPDVFNRRLFCSKLFLDLLKG